MKALRQFLSGAFALSVLALSGWGILVGARTGWAALVAVDPQVAVGVVAAGATLLASTVTIVLGRFFERQKEIESHFRAKKIEIYDEFLSELFKVFHTAGESSEDMVMFMREWQRKLVLWGGEKVLVSYFLWTNHMKEHQDAKSIFLMDAFFRALRADIGLGSSSLPSGAFANLILRRADFFLNEAKRNPQITLDELAKLEKAVYGSD